MILYILQNAYTSDKHPFTNKKEWSKELLRSHSGRRLKEMIPDGAEFKVINASDNIGTHPSSSFKADLKHMSKLINKIKPDIICACGRIAQDGCRELGIKFISAPHPAWRQLSKKITRDIRRKLHG